jgi:hypothetical protein
VTVGAIDPEQRRVAERLILAALRRFHREQPLSVDLRTDALRARVRAAAARRPPSRHRGSTPLNLEEPDLRRVVDDLVADGRLVRHGRRVGLPDAEPTLDPEMAERVRRLLEGLRAAGAAPPRVDGLAARLGIPPTVLDQLRAGRPAAAGRAGNRLPGRRLVGLHARVDAMRGERSVARVRDELRTSRRHAEAILAALADERPAGPHPPSRRRSPRDRRAVR